MVLRESTKQVKAFVSQGELKKEIFQMGNSIIDHWRDHAFNTEVCRAAIKQIMLYSRLCEK